MKIVEVVCQILRIPNVLAKTASSQDSVLVRIRTDDGLEGIGEADSSPEVVKAIIDAPFSHNIACGLRQILIGENPLEAERLWQKMNRKTMYFGRTSVTVSAMAAVDMALWDLKGQAENKPVYELLGGLQQDSLPAYATGGPSNYPQERLAAKIDHYLALGFRGFKLGTGILTDKGFEQPPDARTAAALERDKLRFVRERYGSAVTVCLDGHMGNRPGNEGEWNVETAAAVCDAVEPFDLFFFEEPLHYDNPDGYSELCRRTNVPIAGGECLTGLPEWRTFIEKDCFDIGQPDASYSGGLKLCVDVAKLLEQRGRKIATHAWGAGGSFMQNLHVGFACPNTAILEIAPDYGPLHSEIIGDSFQMRDGRVLPPTKPGLGITLSEKVKRRFPFIPGSGEFNDVPGKSLAEWENRVDAQIAGFLSEAGS